MKVYYASVILNRFIRENACIIPYSINRETSMRSSSILSSSTSFQRPKERLGLFNRDFKESISGPLSVYHLV